MLAYDPEALPDLSGKVIIVTGASAGIDLEAARSFVKNCGAHVILACRSLEKTKPIEEELNAAGPGKATLIRIDMSDLDSVRAFAAEFLALNLGRLDVLALNAGILVLDGPIRMAPSASEEYPTCELQFATNCLGHFLLTQLLLPALTATPKSKVVSVSSMGAEWAKVMDYEMVRGSKPENYKGMYAYAISKLGNLLFTHELGKRLKASGADTVAVPCHPGYSKTELPSKNTASIFSYIDTVLSAIFSQSAEDGAKPLVLASTDEAPEDGVYYAPNGFKQMKGLTTSTAGYFQPLAKDDEESAKFWKFCEDMSGQVSSI